METQNISILATCIWITAARDHLQSHATTHHHGCVGAISDFLGSNAVFFLLSLAFAKNSLDSNKFLQIQREMARGLSIGMKTSNICKNIDRRDDVDLTKPGSDYVFHAILRKLLISRVRPGGSPFHAHDTTRAWKTAGRTLRSQHVLQADRRVFGQSYVASASSCDEFAAFLQDQPDHTALDYLQGISQFWQPGLPTQLPAAKKRELLDLPEMAEYDRVLHKAVDRDAKVKARQDKRNALKRLERKALETPGGGIEAL